MTELPGLSLRNFTVTGSIVKLIHALLRGLPVGVTVVFVVMMTGPDG